MKRKACIAKLYALEEPLVHVSVEVTVREPVKPTNIKPRFKGASEDLSFLFFVVGLHHLRCSMDKAPILPE